METITKLQKTLLQVFSESPGGEHFYLTGGTALAYFYLKHRMSNDLDFFTSTAELIVPFSHSLEERLRATGMFIERKRGLHSFVELGVRRGHEATIVHLAQDANFRIEGTKSFPEYPGLQVESLIDIASNKLLALFGRAMLSDFIDIYVLVKKAKFVPEELIKNAKRKDPGFDLYWLGVAFGQINTFKDDSPEMLMLIEKVGFPELLAFFNKWREKITEELKP